MMQTPGQASGFRTYGGIEEPDLYIAARYGQGICTQELQLSWISSFTQARFEPYAPNCVLVCVTCILDGFRGEGYTGIPEDVAEIYQQVREIGVRHGYNPAKSGFWHDLLVYPPWCVGSIAQEAWRAFGYRQTRVDNRYLRKTHTVRQQLNQGKPVLLNLAIGDYPGHTLTITGMRTYRTKSGRQRLLWEVIDGWDDRKRYIDVKRLFWIPYSITVITRLDPPLG